MEIVDPYEGLYFVFQFCPNNVAPSKNLQYTVYSTKKETLIKFLRQHKFPVNEHYIQIIHPDDPHYIFDDAQELKTVRMGSNKDRTRIFNIVTSSQLLDEAVMRAGDKLSYVSVFGSLVFEDSIPLVSETKALITSMRLGNILDIQEEETDDTKDRVSANKKKWKECSVGPTEQEFYSDGPDDRIIYDTLCELSTKEDIQPITIESYIESFVSLMTDEFD